MLNHIASLALLQFLFKEDIHGNLRHGLVRRLNLVYGLLKLPIVNQLSNILALLIIMGIHLTLVLCGLVLL